jgi:hypothetical protein
MIVDPTQQARISALTADLDGCMADCKLRAGEIEALKAKLCTVLKPDDLRSEAWDALVAWCYKDCDDPDIDGILNVQEITGHYLSMRDQRDRLQSRLDALPGKIADVWVIVATGEGSASAVISGADLHQAVHGFMCFCDRPWRECLSAGVSDDILRLDDADNWDTDDVGNRFSISWEGETGSTTLYRLTEADSIRSLVDAEGKKEGE